MAKAPKGDRVIGVYERESRGVWEVHSVERGMRVTTEHPTAEDAAEAAAQLKYRLEGDTVYQGTKKAPQKAPTDGAVKHDGWAEMMWAMAVDIALDPGDVVAQRAARVIAQLGSAASRHLEWAQLDAGLREANARLDVLDAGQDRLRDTDDADATIQSEPTRATPRAPN